MRAICIFAACILVLVALGMFVCIKDVTSFEPGLYRDMVTGEIVECTGWCGGGQVRIKRTVSQRVLGRDIKFISVETRAKWELQAINGVR